MRIAAPKLHLHRIFPHTAIAALLNQLNNAKGSGALPISVLPWAFSTLGKIGQSFIGHRSTTTSILCLTRTSYCGTTLDEVLSVRPRWPSWLYSANDVGSHTFIMGFTAAHEELDKQSLFYHYNASKVTSFLSSAPSSLHFHQERKVPQPPKACFALPL